MKSDKVKKWLVILGMLLVFLGPPAVCGKSGCISNFEGCEATSQAIQTAIAKPR